MARQIVVSAFLLLIMALWSLASATLEEDEKACAEQLTNLASCIPYVSGGAPKPMPDCCESAEKIRSSQPKCLCVLIVESTDTSMSLPINATLALQMPAACHSSAKVSDCPSILKLSPDSPNAKIFKEATAGASTNPSSTSPGSSSGTGSSDLAASGGGSGSTAATKSGGKRLVLGCVGGGVAGLMAFVGVFFM